MPPYRHNGSDIMSPTLQYVHQQADDEYTDEDHNAPVKVPGLRGRARWPERPEERKKHIQQAGDVDGEPIATKSPPPRR